VGNRRYGSDGDFDIVVTTGGTYNRVEGLPIMVGPRIRWGRPGRTEFVVEALGIGRTAGDFENNREDLGYAARAALTVGDRGAVTVGGRAYDVVAPIESWQLSDAEVGWGTFLWHRDYRDYYLVRGVTGFVEVSPDPDLVLTGSVSRDEESSVSARDPWTLFRRDDAWRPNPRIDGGTYTRYRAAIRFDTRSYPNSGRSGWYLNASWERGQSDDVAQVMLPLSIRTPLPTSDYQYDLATVDFRRYDRMGDGQLRLRAFAAGTMGDDPLPIQRRLSLGGPDPMPGFGFRRFACSTILLSSAEPALCDRLILGQIEYRGGLSFSSDRRLNDRGSRRPVEPLDDWFDVDDWLWFDDPTIVLFADAGTAWIDASGRGDMEADVGAGLEFGGLGVYAAKAVTDGSSARFIVRLQRRF
jgi:hypothetical protein